MGRALLHTLDADTGAAPTAGADADDLPEGPGATLHAHLGRDGMGSVHRGTLEVSGEDVAVKILHPGLAADPAMAARFHQEAETLRRLEHPHVLRVLDAGTLPDGRAWLVTAWPRAAICASGCVRSGPPRRRRRAGFARPAPQWPSPSRTVT